MRGRGMVRIEGRLQVVGNVEGGFIGRRFDIRTRQFRLQIRNADVENKCLCELRSGADAIQND